MKTPPDIVLAGFTKSATSTLAQQLVRFPEIDYHIPDKKEPHTYLHWQLQHAPPAEIKTYQRRKKKCGTLLLDASTGYSVFHDGLTRIAKENPDATVLYILRDPLDRLNSHINWIRKVETRVMPFSVQLKLTPKKAHYSPSGNMLNFIRTSSNYSEAILHARKLFHRVHLIYFSDFTNDQSAVLEEVRETLGLPRLDLNLDSIQANSTASARPSNRKRSPMSLRTLPVKLIGAYTRMRHFLLLEVVYRLRFGVGTVDAEQLEWTPDLEKAVLTLIAEDAERYEMAGIQLDKFPTLKDALNNLNP